ncbi:MAG: hypothetical protein ABI045_05040 [Flavobacteriales bacterium]
MPAKRERYCRHLVKNPRFSDQKTYHGLRGVERLSYDNEELLIRLYTY